MRVTRFSLRFVIATESSSSSAPYSTSTSGIESADPNTAVSPRK